MGELSWNGVLVLSKNRHYYCIAPAAAVTDMNIYKQVHYPLQDWFHHSHHLSSLSIHTNYNSIAPLRRYQNPLSLQLLHPPCQCTNSSTCLPFSPSSLQLQFRLHTLTVDIPGPHAAQLPCPTPPAHSGRFWLTLVEPLAIQIRGGANIVLGGYGDPCGLNLPPCETLYHYETISPNLGICSDWDVQTYMEKGTPVNPFRLCRKGLECVGYSVDARLCWLFELLGLLQEKSLAFSWLVDGDSGSCSFQFKYKLIRPFVTFFASSFCEWIDPWQPWSSICSHQGTRDTALGCSTNIRDKV